MNNYRKNVRLKNYDYATSGAYFVTICTDYRACILGAVDGSSVTLTSLGEIVLDEWLDLPSRFPGVTLDAAVVMPNHFHGILVLTPQVKAPAVRLSRVIQAFKSLTTRRINALRQTPGAALWQANYHEHVIRSEDALKDVRAYIGDNPRKWRWDRENPDRLERIRETTM